MKQQVYEEALKRVSALADSAVNTVVQRSGSWEHLPTAEDTAAAFAALASAMYDIYQISREALRK